MSTSTKETTSPSSAEIALPEVVLNYIAAANDGRVEDAAACFADDALVHDENRDRQGLEAIREWIADSTREFQPKNEVLSVKAEADSYTVVSNISGNFPGSPVDLEFRFVVDNVKISQLFIR
ncbi:MAG: nuclear transport factor 2 family protein [Verrucomicrobiales bacterium]